MQPFVSITATALSANSQPDKTEIRRFIKKQFTFVQGNKVNQLKLQYYSRKQLHIFELVYNIHCNVHICACVQFDKDTKISQI